MNQPPIEIEPQLLRTGLKRAMTRNRDTVLCILSPTSLRLISVSSLRMMVSWEHPIAGPQRPQYYIFPALVTHLLTGPLGQDLQRITLSLAGKDVSLGMTDAYNDYQWRWQADLRHFYAPPEFVHMIAVPRGLLTISYLSLSDAAHQAVANLVNLESLQDIPPEKLAILIDFSSSHMTLDGRNIVRGARGAFYFDPRLVIRALEIVKANTLQVGMTPLPKGHRAVLTLLARQDQWRVQCALLSVGADTQKLYPLPPE